MSLFSIFDVAISGKMSGVMVPLLYFIAGMIFVGGLYKMYTTEFTLPDFSNLAIFGLFLVGAALLFFAQAIFTDNTYGVLFYVIIIAIIGMLLVSNGINEQTKPTNQK